jgi:hypothetical protein
MPTCGAGIETCSQPELPMRKDEMKETKRSIWKICFLAVVMVAPALAQKLQSAPAAAVTGPSYNLALGYSYLSMRIPGAGSANLNGLDFSGSLGLSPRWGATLDSNYLYAHDLLGTHHQAYVLSLYTGPVFYPVSHRNTRVFVHALGGAALVDGAVPIAENKDFHGWLVRPSYAFGGGVERPISDQLGVRVIGDYLRTDFYNSAGAVQPQNNLRLTVNFVFRLKQRSRRSSVQLR